MSEPKYREWILDSIDSLRSRKARPDLDRICRMVRRRHGSDPDRTCAELEKLIQEQTVLKVNYKGSISYRNAAKVQRRSRKKDDVAARRSVLEEASNSDLSNGDSALGPPDQDETEDLEADGSMAMDTDSNVEEDGGEESRDGQEGRSGCEDEEAPVQCPAVHAFSAPCSPSVARPGPSSSLSPGPSAGPDNTSPWKANGRPSSLPSSSPKALLHNDWTCDSSAFCPVERHNPGVQRDEGALKPAVQPVVTSPCGLKSGLKKEDAVRMEDSVLSSDQLVPDYGTRPDETRKISDGRPQTLPVTSDTCAKFKSKIEVASLVMVEDGVLNGGNNGEVSVKKENARQNLLQWSVADVASYFSAAGFPEQAVAFRTQEIDGKSLLLMQRSDVLTGLSIRLGPALKIYERHVKVLQRTHFLEDEDL